MNVCVKAIAYHLPERVVTNDELSAKNVGWNMALVSERAGVEARYLARTDETAYDLSVKACRKLFQSHPEAREQIDGLIFCTQSEDYIMPPNSCLLHRELGLPDDVFAFDFNLACSGYVYGLGLARGLICSQTARNVLLVTADTYSKYIHPQDRSASVLFGDGAAVSWIATSTGPERIIDLQCSTSGKDYAKFIIPAGGHRTPKSASTSAAVVDPSGNVRSSEHIQMDGLGVLAFVNTKVPPQVRALLERNKLTVADIDLFVFHQASKLALDSIARLLEIHPDKEFRNIERVGNTVSASIPMALKDAMSAGKAKPGDLVLLCGFGVGLSWGTVLLQL